MLIPTTTALPPDPRSVHEKMQLRAASIARTYVVTSIAKLGRSSSLNSTAKQFRTIGTTSEPSQILTHLSFSRCRASLVAYGTNSESFFCCSSDFVNVSTMCLKQPLMPLLLTSEGKLLEEGASLRLENDILLICI